MERIDKVRNAANAENVASAKNVASAENVINAENADNKTDRGVNTNYMWWAVPVALLAAIVLCRKGLIIYKNKVSEPAPAQTPTACAPTAYTSCTHAYLNGVKH